jgi:DNA-binding NarL/FixJ family response regulator
VNEETRENRIHLLLLDDQALFRSSLAHLLASEPGLEVVGECGNCAEAVEMLSGSPVDVVLLDFAHATDGADGFMAAARRNGYRGQFLVVAGGIDARAAALAIKLGASGIFPKSEGPGRLVQAITLVSHGAVWLDQKIIHLLADETVDRFPQGNDEESGNHLSEREQRVLLGILGGLTNKKIGSNLGLSEGSVKASVQQLFYKTGVRTRSQLVRAALEGSLGAAGGLTRRTQSERSNIAPLTGEKAATSNPC